MFLDNKYTKCYYNLINKAKTRNTKTKVEAKLLLGYVEDHHIIPESLGGPNSIDNMVFLTAHEHLVCHLLLPKMTAGKDKAKMINAVWAMTTLENCNQSRRKITGRTYAKIREQFSKSHSLAMTGYKQKPEQGQKISNALKGKPSSLKGIPRPESVKLKIAATLRGVPKSEKHKENLKLAHVGFSGKSPSTETRKKISMRKLTTPKIQCIYCDKICDPGNHKRHHGDNCKLFNIRSR
jgi:hypothetical protein